MADETKKVFMSSSALRIKGPISWEDTVQVHSQKHTVKELDKRETEAPKLHGYIDPSD